MYLLVGRFNEWYFMFHFLKRCIEWIFSVLRYIAFIAFVMEFCCNSCWFEGFKNSNSWMVFHSFFTNTPTLVKIKKCQPKCQVCTLNSVKQKAWQPPSFKGCQVKYLRTILFDSSPVTTTDVTGYISSGQHKETKKTRCKIANNIRST